MAIVGAGWWWSRDAVEPVVPPEVSLDGADDEVRTTVTTARDRVAAEPESAAAWGRYGQILRAHGYEYEADRCFLHSARLAPDDPRWPYYRGLHALLRDPDHALPFLRQAASLKASTPGHASAINFRLAEAMIERGALDEAETLIRRERAQSPTDPRANLNAAIIALARGETRSASSQLAVAATSPFAQKKATSMLASVARLLGDAEVAVKHEQAARNLPDDLPWVDPYVTDYTDLQVGIQSKFQKAESLKAQGRPQEAAQEMVAIAEAQRSPRAYVAAGIALAEMGQHGPAERYLRACLQIEPDHIQANYFLGVVLFLLAEADWERSPETARPRFRESVIHSRRCLSRKPDHGIAYQFLGRALMRLGELADAIVQLRQAVACRPEVAETHLSLAQALLEDGQVGEARKSLASAEQVARAGDPAVRAFRDRLASKGGKGK
jgi:tetratricopeptide (TPR) repeat protein